MKKIPDHAKKVFEGVLHDVYHWDQEMFDGTIATFEALKRREAVTIIAVVDNNYIILNEEEQPYNRKFLTLPGGNSETFNYIEDAQRELLEETGYTSDDWQELCVVDILKYEKMEWNNHFHIARNAKKVQEQTLDGGEKIKTRLISFDQLLGLRYDSLFRNKDLFSVLDKAANDELEKQKLKSLLGITT